MKHDVKTKVVVCRKWKNPNIEAYVSAEEIGVRLDLNDYLEAMCHELGNPTLLFTRAGIAKRVHAANDAILAEIKKATTEV